MNVFGKTVVFRGVNDLAETNEIWTFPYSSKRQLFLKTWDVISLLPIRTRSKIIEFFLCLFCAPAIGTTKIPGRLSWRPTINNTTRTHIENSESVKSSKGTGTYRKARRGLRWNVFRNEEWRKESSDSNPVRNVKDVVQECLPRGSKDRGVTRLFITISRSKRTDRITEFRTPTMTVVTLLSFLHSVFNFSVCWSQLYFSVKIQIFQRSRKLFSFSYPL